MKKKCPKKWVPAMAFIANEIAGFVMGYKLDSWHRNEKEILLYDIEVLQKFRRYGIGTKLVEALKGLAVKERFKELWIPTNKSNKGAVEFYKKIGGIQKYNDDIFFTLLLKDDKTL